MTARDLWKKKYFEEKKKTPPVDETSKRLRHELNIEHQKIEAQLKVLLENARKNPNQGNKTPEEVRVLKYQNA